MNLYHKLCVITFFLIVKYDGEERESYDFIIIHNNYDYSWMAFARQASSVVICNINLQTLI